MWSQNLHLSIFTKTFAFVIFTLYHQQGYENQVCNQAAYGINAQYKFTRNKCKPLTNLRLLLQDNGNRDSNSVCNNNMLSFTLTYI